MSSKATWKLQKDDSPIDEFTDIRRKVGNQVIRAYLLDTVVDRGSIDRVPGRLRGPKNEFKDFAKFLILQLSVDGSSVRFLAEAGVYENLRIVAVDSNDFAKRDSKDLIRIFTDALDKPEQYNTKLVLSDDSKVR
jgi:hypothetical protein